METWLRPTREGTCGPVDLFPEASAYSESRRLKISSHHYSLCLGGCSQPALHPSASLLHHSKAKRAFHPLCWTAPINSAFIHQTFISFLLCASHWARCWGDDSVMVAVLEEALRRPTGKGLPQICRSPKGCSTHGESNQVLPCDLLSPWYHPDLRFHSGMASDTCLGAEMAQMLNKTVSSSWARS